MTHDKPEEGPPQRPKWLRFLALIILFVPLVPFVAYRVWQVIEAKETDDPEGAIAAIKETDKLSRLIRGRNAPMSKYDRAEIATMLVLQDKLTQAQNEFATIRSELHGNTSSKAKYLKYYCNYWLANIRGDWEQSEYELRQAQKLPYRSSSLWLPEPKGQDDLDLAFDHELLDAAERAGMTVEEFVRQQVIKN